MSDSLSGPYTTSDVGRDDDGINDEFEFHNGPALDHAGYDRDDDDNFDGRYVEPKAHWLKREGLS
jgi:hypothetical protein